MPAGRWCVLGWTAACLALSPAAFADWQAGIDAYKASDFEQAVAEFRQFVDERPDEHVGHLMLGRSLFGAGRTDEAIEPLERALELRPDYDAARLYLGRLLLHAARTTEGHWVGIRYCERAAEVLRGLVKDSPTYDHLLLLGQAQLGAERYRAAASVLRRAGSLEPGDWRAYVILGQTFAHRGRHKKAEASLRTALGLADGEDRNLVLNWLGFVLRGQGRYAEAAEAYHNAGNPEAAQEVREAQRRAREEAEDFEALVEAIRRGGPPKWLPGDPVQVSDAARSQRSPASGPSGR